MRSNRQRVQVAQQQRSLTGSARKGAAGGRSKLPSFHWGKGGSWQPEAGVHPYVSKDDEKAQELEAIEEELEVEHAIERAERAAGVSGGDEPDDPERLKNRLRLKGLKEKYSKLRAEETKHSLESSYKKCFERWILGKEDLLNDARITPWSYETLAERFPRVVNFATSKLHNGTTIQNYLFELFTRGPQSEREVEIYFKYLVYPVHDTLRQFQLANATATSEGLDDPHDLSLDDLHCGGSGELIDDDNLGRRGIFAFHRSWLIAERRPLRWPRHAVFGGLGRKQGSKVPLPLDPAINRYMRPTILPQLTYQEYVTKDYSKLSPDVQELWEVANDRFSGRVDRNVRPGTEEGQALLDMDFGAGEAANHDWMLSFDRGAKTGRRVESSTVAALRNLRDSDPRETKTCRPLSRKIGRRDGGATVGEGDAKMEVDDEDIKLEEYRQRLKDLKGETKSQYALIPSKAHYQKLEAVEKLQHENREMQQKIENLQKRLETLQPSQPAADDTESELSDDEYLSAENGPMDAEDETPVKASLTQPQIAAAPPNEPAKKQIEAPPTQPQIAAAPPSQPSKLEAAEQKQIAAPPATPQISAPPVEAPPEEPPSQQQMEAEESKVTDVIQDVVAEVGKKWKFRAHQAERVDKSGKKRHERGLAEEIAGRGQNKSRRVGTVPEEDDVEQLIENHFTNGMPVNEDILQMWNSVFAPMPAEQKRYFANRARFKMRTRAEIRERLNAKGPLKLEAGTDGDGPTVEEIEDNAVSQHLLEASPEEEKEAQKIFKLHPTFAAAVDQHAAESIKITARDLVKSDKDLQVAVLGAGREIAAAHNDNRDEIKKKIADIYSGKTVSAKEHQLLTKHFNDLPPEIQKEIREMAWKIATNVAAARQTAKRVSQETGTTPKKRRRAQIAGKRKMEGEAQTAAKKKAAEGLLALGSAPARTVEDKRAERQLVALSAPAKKQTPVKEETGGQLVVAKKRKPNKTMKGRED